jgi:hypothetical protein
MGTLGLAFFLLRNFMEDRIFGILSGGVAR